MLSLRKKGGWQERKGERDRPAINMDVLGWLVAFLFLFLCFWMSQRPKGFPPGPWILPLLGNLNWYISRDPFKKLNQLGKIYGPIFSLYLGTTPTIFIHGFSSAKEVLVTRGTEFAERAAFPIMDAITNRKGILTLRYGEAWKEQRRFALMLLRNFGMGKRSIEEKILEEAASLIQVFTKNMSVPFHAYAFMDIAVINIISIILLGKRFEYDNDFIRTLLDNIHHTSQMTIGFWSMLYNEVPLLRSLPLPHQTILTIAKEVDVFIKKEIKEHKETLTPGEPRDFTDAYLEEMQKPERKASSFEEEQLQFLLSDQLIAGTETTSGTLQWGFLYLMAFPEIQEKCWKEIDTVVGSKASLEYKDRKKLPYTNAVLHEIQRVSSVVPLALPHAAIKDVQLFGYTIPKDTMILVNIHSAHHDESHWKFPSEFNPSNFLNEEGEFVKPEAFMPFSAGPRVCLGEILAQMELFLFFTSILRNFQLSWPDRSQAPDFTPHLGITLFPSRFKMLLKCRRE